EYQRHIFTLKNLDGNLQIFYAPEYFNKKIEEVHEKYEKEKCNEQIINEQKINLRIKEVFQVHNKMLENFEKMKQQLYNYNETKFNHLKDIKEYKKNCKQIIHTLRLEFQDKIKLLKLEHQQQVSYLKSNE